MRCYESNGPGPQKHQIHEVQWPVKQNRPLCGEQKESGEGKRNESADAEQKAFDVPVEMRGSAEPAQDNAGQKRGRGAPLQRRWHVIDLGHTAVGVVVHNTSIATWGGAWAYLAEYQQCHEE